MKVLKNVTGKHSLSLTPKSALAKVSPGSTVNALISLATKPSSGALFLPCSFRTLLHFITKAGDRSLAALQLLYRRDSQVDK